MSAIDPLESQAAHGEAKEAAAGPSTASAAAPASARQEASKGAPAERQGSLERDLKQQWEQARRHMGAGGDTLVRRPSAGGTRCARPCQRPSPKSRCVSALANGPHACQLQPDARLLAPDA